MSNPLDPAGKVFGQILPGVTYEDRPGAYAFMLNDRREIAVVKTSFGFFLPGGGLDPGEDELTALARELNEEIGYVMNDAVFLMRASQYHWSEFYRKHFRKMGAFFQVTATPPARDTWAHGHTLVWLPLDRAAAELSQEFQRWAAQEFSRLNP